MITKMWMILFVVVLLTGARSAAACSCAGLPDQSRNDYINEKLNQATTVFLGKAVELEYRSGIPNPYKDMLGGDLAKATEWETLVVKFSVDLSWKGKISSEIILATAAVRQADGRSSYSSCDFSFKKGVDYLVYASEKDGVVRTHACSGTRIADDVKDDTKILGVGTEPIRMSVVPSLPPTYFGPGLIPFS